MKHRRVNDLRVGSCPPVSWAMSVGDASSSTESRRFLQKIAMMTAMKPAITNAAMAFHTVI